MALAKDSSLLRAAPERVRGGRVVYRETFRQVAQGVFNDGLGYVMSDTNIWFAGLPTLRLDTGGQSTGPTTDPGRTAATSGVVVKRRIHDNYLGKWGVACWFRFTSLNLTSNAKFSMSIYNRNGSQAHHFRVWLDPAGNNAPMHARILNGGATAALSGTNGSGAAVYTDVLTSVLQNGGGSHTYDPPSGRMDVAGGWHYAKMDVDFSTGKYVGLWLDSEYVDLSAYSWDITDTTGFAGMHHSFEFGATTATRRYMHIANWVGTLED